MNYEADRGFSLVELVVALAIVLAVTGAIFQLLNPAYGVFGIELERADMQQRMRTSLDAMFRDLALAGAGGQSPAVAPYRRGARNPDMPGAVFADRVSVMLVPSDGGPGDAQTITYWLRTGPGDGPQLMRYDGHDSDLPVADQVSALRFDYFGDAGTAITPGHFGDGPWLPDAVSPGRYDADLAAVRRVRITLRVRPARILLPVPLRDGETVIDVSPRNLNLS
jgi:prepilin-type N-terminal cleavage/methylation domain-containing protein